MLGSRPVNVGFAWCCESVSECGVGVSGTQDCCQVHETQTLLRRLPRTGVVDGDLI